MGRIPSSNSRTTIASSLNVVPVLSQASENAALKQTHDQEDPGGICSEKLSQLTTPKSVVAEHSLWALAYDGLQQKNPELIKKFNYCLGISIADTNDGNLIYPKIEGVAQKALKEIEQANKSKEKLNKTSAAIQTCFEQAVKVIIASKDFISSAVSANPYAVLAWTGVSLLLPVSQSEILFHITNTRKAPPQSNSGE